MLWLPPITDARFAAWLVFVLFTILLEIIPYVESGNGQKGKLLMPQMYSPIEGDLYIQLHHFNTDTAQSTDSTETATRLHISRFEGLNRTSSEFIDIFPDPRLNITQIVVPCQYFLFGGFYELEIVENGINSTEQFSRDERLKQQLDVRWPIPKLSVTPESIGTYPQQPVDAILEFPGVECIASHSKSMGVPEFWVELFYCGHEVLCDLTNTTGTLILFKEQVRGYPKAHLIKLSCELFGLAGHYVVKLRPVSPVSVQVTASAFIKVDWSEQFVFNVHARSIFPCDPHAGIGVLFEYPACILDNADRVRLYGKHRILFSSLQSPTVREYIAEKKVIRGQHSLYFDCDYFSEKYIEYCFVYVSQAISGAVADVRTDCVTTSAVNDTDMAGWGNWSEWTPCSTTCANGTRSRYRVCDSPPPKYGMPFCKGEAVEREKCGSPNDDLWDCLYGAKGSYISPDFMPINKSDTKLQVGTTCRCGCVVHLTTGKPVTLVTSSAESCPGRSLWLIQADENYRIRLHFDFFRLVCQTQYIKIRDGDSTGSELIAENYGGAALDVDPIISTDSKLLLEFFSDDFSKIGDSCKGGFLIHVQQMHHIPINETLPITSKAIMPVRQISPNLTLVHVIAILFTCIILVVSIMLGAQYIVRYRKYELTGSRGEPDSPAHTPRASITSLTIPSRAVSTSTLLSEVVSLVKLRPKTNHRMKHSRLRESVDGEALEMANDRKQCDRIERNQLDEDDVSLESTSTLTNAANLKGKNNKNSKESSLSSSCGDHSGDNTYCDDANSSTVSSVSIVHSPVPLETMRKLLRQRKREKLENTSKQGKKSPTRRATDCTLAKLKRDCSQNISAEEYEIDTDSSFSITHDKFKSRRPNLRKYSASNITLTNIRNSPALSIISSSTRRSSNIKESKDKRNRETLLAGPGSEFSLANPDMDLELDYYDYNVTNAGAAPGSYLGMDPAYLVWIPPLEEGIAIDTSDESDDEDEDPDYEEISHEISDKSTELYKTERQKNGSSSSLKDTSNNDEQSKNLHNLQLNKFLVANTFQEIPTKLIVKPTEHSVLRKFNMIEPDNIQMKEFVATTKAGDRQQNASSSCKPTIVCNKIYRDGEDKDVNTEKETAVMKEYYNLDEIQFADDEDAHEITNSQSKEPIERKSRIRTMALSKSTSK